MSLSDQIWCQGSADVGDLPQSSQIESVGITYAMFPCAPAVMPALAVYTRQWSLELINLAMYARTLGVPLIRLSPRSHRPSIVVAMSDNITANMVRELIDRFWLDVARRYTYIINDLRDIPDPARAIRRVQSTYRDHYYL